MAQSLASAMSFLMAFSAILGVAFLVFRPNADSRRGIARLRDGGEGDGDGTGKREISITPLGLARSVGGGGRDVLQTLGGSLFVTRSSRDTLQKRLRQAGIHNPQAVLTYLGLKCVLFMTLLTLGILVGCALRLGNPLAISIGAFGAIFGLLAPEVWVGFLLKRRRRAFRRALPDALDMLVLCLEGGLSINGAMQRVTAEVRRAHPLLADEMETMLNEMQLGRSVGESVKSFGTRSDFREVHELAGVILQSEQYGASLVKPLRLHSDLARQERHRRAEETAQKAAVKILFPTLLFIFPAIFIVILGPAAYHLADIFSHR